ncbi:hypothetical protein MKW98_023086 [Papaver atlanticum]|uniref:MULE transposase domain-containing protein n=1 Tax=Papaver atlanticum TaxID=357466 RepID=A0AAD4TAN0_9MAGN|nr:hypothetical protein MKW98_023086 [Papaver atlanticum]
MACQMAILFRKEFAKCDCVYTPNQLMHDMRIDYGITITYKQAYSGCKRGTEAVRGSPDDSYQYLVGYRHMLQLHNEGKKWRFILMQMMLFCIIFFALGACLHGFKTWCRPAFAVDGTHLSGDGHGVLLLAVGFDANDQILPIAFAIVDSENNESCEWFMQQLFDALGTAVSSREDLVVCSDGSQSIEHGVSTVSQSPMWSIAYGHKSCCGSLNVET